MFVAATIYADGASSPVNIRNLSQTGALIEGPVLPDVGERIALKRGQLQVSGWIAWRVERKAGVRLDASVHIPDWIKRQVSSGQERVDALLELVRSDAAPPADPVTVPGQAASVEAELRQLRTELGELERRLIEDPVLVAAHPEIQTIDISLQRIDRIVEGWGSGG